MNQSELLRELSRRTALPEATTGAVFESLRELLHEGAIDVNILGEAAPAIVHDAGQPHLAAAERLPVTKPDDPSLVEDLIARARKHPMGLEFLASGLLASVAIALGAHAFTVEAARERLRKEQQTSV